MRLLTIRSVADREAARRVGSSGGGRRRTAHGAHNVAGSRAARAVLAAVSRSGRAGAGRSDAVAQLDERGQPVRAGGQAVQMLISATPPQPGVAWSLPSTQVVPEAKCCHCGPRKGWLAMMRRFWAKNVPSGKASPRHHPGCWPPGHIPTQPLGMCGSGSATAMGANASPAPARASAARPCSAGVARSVVMDHYPLVQAGNSLSEWFKVPVNGLMT